MFAHTCILCGARAAGRDLCGGCHADLPWPGPSCVRCAAPLPPSAGVAVCGPCIRRPPVQAATVAALDYAFPVDQLLLTLKFGKALPPGRVLGELLAGAVIGASVREAGLRGQRAAPTVMVDTIVPVPLHPRRLRERGFNQALELARPVARALRRPILVRACRRLRDTPPQSGLAGKDRRRNLAGAFVADTHVAGLHLAVIDDVYTTGSTVGAVARALYRAGARRVDAWCVARASRYWDRRQG